MDLLFNRMDIRSSGRTSAPGGTGDGHQEPGGTCLVEVEAGRRLEAGGDVVLDYEPGDQAEPGPGGRQLIEDLQAGAAVLVHPPDVPDLPLDTPEARLDPGRMPQCRRRDLRPGASRCHLSACPAGAGE